MEATTNGTITKKSGVVSTKETGAVTKSGMASIPVRRIMTSSTRLVKVVIGFPTFRLSSRIAKMIMDVTFNLVT